MPDANMGNCRQVAPPIAPPVWTIATDTSGSSRSADQQHTVQPHLCCGRMVCMTTWRMQPPAPAA
jgi:hypothetical protein